jgi:IS5 family transposase
MAHPLHAATSFECDGCGHHASFHMLVNKEEDEVVARWRAVKEEEERVAAEAEERMKRAVEEAEERGRGLGKRKRGGKRGMLTITNGNGNGLIKGERVVEVSSGSEAEQVALGVVGPRRRGGTGRGQ